MKSDIYISLLCMFVLGTLLGWALATVQYKENIYTEIKKGVESTLSNGILRDNDGNIFVAVPK